MTLLLRSAGLMGEPDPDDEAIGKLARTALEFARAGGAPTLSEWLLLTGCERAALVSAREGVRAEDAVRRAIASSGADGAARVLGDDATAQLAVERAASDAAARIGSTEVAP